MAGRQKSLADLGNNVYLEMGGTTAFKRFQRLYRDDRVAFVYDCIPKLKDTFAPYQEEILANYDQGYRRQAIRGPRGLGKCVAYGERIRLADGSLVNAEELIGESFRVPSVTKDLSICVKNARAFYNGVQDIVEILTDRGRIIRRTCEHPLWGDQSPQRWMPKRSSIGLYPNGHWVNADNFRPGSVVAVYAGHLDAEDFPMPDHQIKLLAYLIGDGGVSQNGVYFTSLPGAKADEFAECCDLCGALSDLIGYLQYRVTAKENCDRQYNGVPVNPVLELSRAWGLQGHTAHSKRFPDFVWRFSNRQLALLLSRLFSCDGWAHNGKRANGRTNAQIGYCSVNLGLAQDVLEALLRLGIQGAIYEKTTTWTHNGEKKHGTAYSITISDVENGLRFCAEIGIFGKEREVHGAYNRWLGKESKSFQWRRYNLPDAFRWEKVIRVTRIRNVPTVSISVEDTHTFLTQFVEHNSMLAAILVHHVLLTTEEDVTVPTLASVERQLIRYLWPEIRKVASFLNWKTIGREPYSRDELMTTSIRTNNGLSEAFAVAAGDSASIEGAHASRIFYIFDESKTIEEAMWDSAEGAFSTEGLKTLGSTTTSECYWFAISTPGPAYGRFYDIHARKEGYEDWLVRHVTIEEAIQAGRVPGDWVEQRKKQWGAGSAMYKNHVLGEFASDDTEGVIPLDWVQAAMERWRDWDEAGRIGEGLGNRVLGVDTARMGDDFTVFADRVGDRLEKLYIYAKQTVPQVAGYLKPLAQRSAEVKIEMDSGLGAGLYDMLTNEESQWDQSMNLIPLYMGAGTSLTDKTGTFRFSCVRSAAWWKMRELLDPANGGNIALYPSDNLLGDLTAPRYEIKYWHGDLTIFVEPKEALKKASRLGRSTDEGDATVIAFFDEGQGGGGVVF